MNRALSILVLCFALALVFGAVACSRRDRARPPASPPSTSAAQPVAKSAPPAEAPAELPRAASGAASRPPQAYRTTAPADSRAVRFRPLAVELEIGAQPVSAWQVELTVVAGDARIVGVEGGTAEGFREPPYYDSAAMLGGRIVLAGLNAFTSLPSGRHRVATVHVREEGGSPTYELRLVAAAGPEGAPAAARAVLALEKGEQP